MTVGVSCERSAFNTRKNVEDLKFSGSVHEVRAARKFYDIIADIEKFGGVSEFWFDFLSHIPIPLTIPSSRV